MASIFIEDSMATRFPRHIDVQAHGKEFKLLIDGFEFPWYIHEDGVAVSVTEGGPQITITLIAERVTVDHSIL